MLFQCIKTTLTQIATPCFFLNNDCSCASPQFFRSVFLEQALDPEAVLDRAPPIPHEDLSPPPLKYRRARPCGPPLTSSGYGFVSAMHNQLCTKKATTFTTVVIDDVSKMLRGSGRSVIVKVDALLMNRQTLEDFYLLKLMGRLIRIEKSTQPKAKFVELLKIRWNSLEMLVLHFVKLFIFQLSNAGFFKKASRNASLKLIKEVFY